MAISVLLTLGATQYDISGDVKRDSIEIDEQLFNESDLRPTTNRCTMVLSRRSSIIPTLFAWGGTVGVSVSADGAPCFTGYLTDNYTLAISCRGKSDVKLQAEDPGIKKLKTAWVSANGLYTSLNGVQVCNPAAPGSSFVHILADRAGVTLSPSLPTISDIIYYTVQDKDKKQYWEIAEKILYDFLYTFYFDASGRFCLYYFGALTGTPTTTVRSDGSIVQRNPGDDAIVVSRRLIQYGEVVVDYHEAETVSSAVIYRDTTGQGLTDCEIPIAPGGYYPSACDAATYAYIDYQLEDGRAVLEVASVAADFALDSGIEYELTNLGKSARIRFHNTSAITAYIRKLKIIGNNVIAEKAMGKVTSTEAGGKRLDYSADYITTSTQAGKLANMLRYFYANSGSLYTFRSFHGVLYPGSIYPGAYYPLGDDIALGEIVRLQDPLWTGLDVAIGVYRKRYTVGRAVAQYDAVGIGDINLSAATVTVPTVTARTAPQAQSIKLLSSLADPVDYAGQYGSYQGTRYIGTPPTTWTRDDAGQTRDEVAGIVPIYTPHYLGAHKDSAPDGAKEGDVYLQYSETAGDAHRGVFRFSGGAWQRTTDPAAVYMALSDIAAICQILSTDSATHIYGTESEYGITATMETAHIMAAIIDRLRVGDLTISGLLQSPLMDTVAPRAGDTIHAPTPTYWPGSALVSHCSTLPNGWTAVSDTSTLDGKNVTHVVKSNSSSVSLQANDAVVSHGGTGWYTAKTITSAAKGLARIYFKYLTEDFLLLFPANTGYFRVLVNGSQVYYSSEQQWVLYGEISFDSRLNYGDTITLQIRSSNDAAVYVKDFRIAPAAGTVAVWNDTDNTALIIDSSSYYSQAGAIYLSGLADFATSSIDDYWSGDDFLDRFVGKIRAFKLLSLGGGTFHAKTCSQIYMTDTTLTLYYTDSTSDVIQRSGYYSYTGYVTFPTIEGKILLGDPTNEGQYELWSHDIPGTSDQILTIRNTATTDAHTIWEIRAPDKTTGASESTLSLHGVVGANDYVNDKSLHNYSGTMHVHDVFSNFSGSIIGSWKWIKNALVNGAMQETVAAELTSAGNLTIPGGINATGGVLSGTTLTTSNYSSTTAIKSYTFTLAAGVSSSNFTIYKPVMAIISGTYLWVELVFNSAYYTVLTEEQATALNPGVYRVHNISGDSASGTLYIVGVYGTTSNTDIWSLN